MSTGDWETSEQIETRSYPEKALETAILGHIAATDPERKPAA